jgi:hypothetical protein
MEMILVEKLSNFDPVIDIKQIVRGGNRENWCKIRSYISKYNEKCDSALIISG